MTKRHTESVQHSSKDACWRTPKELFDQLDQEFDFLIDAAADRDNRHCVNYFGPDHDNPTERNALIVHWMHESGGDPIFLNPPYSRELVNAYTTGRIKIDGSWVDHPIDPIAADSYRIASWVKKCWVESQRGCTIVGLIPYSPQTDWWRKYVEGQDPEDDLLSNFHAAREVRKIPHRVSFLRPDGTEADNAGGNTAVVVWKPAHGIVPPWVPFNGYWDYL